VADICAPRVVAGRPISWSTIGSTAGQGVLMTRERLVLVLTAILVVLAIAALRAAWLH